MSIVTSRCLGETTVALDQETVKSEPPVVAPAPRAAKPPHHRELAASHYPMPPVRPTERIAHLDTADCCIHPPGRNEMIAITPPKIFSKEVAQNRPPHFPARISSPPEIVSDQ